MRRLGDVQKWLGVVAGPAALTALAADDRLEWPARWSVRLEDLDQLASVGSFLLVAIGLVAPMAVARWRRRPAAELTDPLVLDAVRAMLARAVRRQWDKEAGLRGLRHGRRLDVRWRLSDRYGPAAARLVGGRAWRGLLTGARRRDGGGALRRGDTTKLAEMFHRLTVPQLVVVGGPGAGKTSAAILLVRDLLDADADRGQAPVPVLVAVAGWDPSAPFDEWLADQINAQYPVLAASRGRGRRVAAELVAGGDVLPVLDGLDEMPAQARAMAISGLGQALGRRPAIVTCRTREYGEAVRTAGLFLGDAAVVELEPLTVSDAVGYLPARRLDGAGGWPAVLDHLRSNPSGPLAEALSTPLMLSLVAAVYANPAAPGQVPPDPRELLDSGRFGDRHSIELHLFDGLLAAAYPPPSYDRWSVHNARRWLAWLAADLQRRTPPATGFAWWRLPSMAWHRPGPAPLPARLPARLRRWLPARLRRWLPPTYTGDPVSVLVGLVAGLAYGVPAALGERVGIGAGVGILPGIALGFAVGLPVRRNTARPGGLRLPGPGLAGGLLGGLAGGLAAGLAHSILDFGRAPSLIGGLPGALGVGIWVGPACGFAGGAAGGAAGGLVAGLLVGLWAGLPAGLANGLGVGVAAAVIVAVCGRDQPARGPRWSVTGLAIAAPVGLAIGLAGLLAVSPRGGLLLGAVGALVGALAGGLIGGRVAPASAADPRTTLAEDRRAFWLVGLAVGGTGLLIGLLVGGQASTVQQGRAGTVVTIVQKGLAIGLSVGISLGLVFAFTHAAWGAYTLARCWLAVRGRLPWSLMAFLAGAHQRGVLRQAGASYEFCHADLQLRLAAWHHNGSTAAPGRERAAHPSGGDPG